MAYRYIWIRGQRYYYYDGYDTYQKAKEIAKWYRKKNKKCKYFILKIERGFWFPQDKYVLYLNKVVRLL